MLQIMRKQKHNNNFIKAVDFDLKYAKHHKFVSINDLWNSNTYLPIPT